LVLAVLGVEGLVIGVLGVLGEFAGVVDVGLVDL